MTGGGQRSVTGAVLCALAALLAPLLVGCSTGNDRSALTGHPSGTAHLVLRLASECRLDESRERLVLPDGTRFEPPLAFSYELRPMIPDLADRDRSELSADEANLASYVLLLTESDGDTATALRSAPSWPCVEEAREAPRLSLP